MVGQLAAVLARLRRTASLSLVRTEQRLLMYLERRDFVTTYHRDVSIEHARARSFVLLYQHSDRHAPGITKSAICVQRFDDSLNSAIHTTYRSWLRSSSMHEPRDPPLKVINTLVNNNNNKLNVNKRI